MITRRVAGAAAAAVVTAMSLAGCNATRELTVVFTAGTTDTQRAAAMHACTGAAPHTSPEPIPTPTSRTARSLGALVRFRIDKATDRDIARLEQCLQDQPGVKGFQDSAS